MNFNPDELFLKDEGFEHRKVKPLSEKELHANNITLTVKKLLELKIGEKSELTNEQKKVVEQLAGWICGEGKPQSGILILGSVGSGKTTVMQAFIRYYNWLYNKVIKEYHSKVLPMEYKTKGIDYFYKRPIFIDDLGKESASTVEYGQRYDTWGDLFAVRYELKSLTFATANYKLDGQFKEIYGEVITDRMKEHFNIFELVGESLRK